jgi:pyranose oxidase
VTSDAYPVTAATRALRSRLSGLFDPPSASSIAVRAMPLACTVGPDSPHPVWTGSGTVLGDLAEATAGERDFWLIPDCAATRIVTSHSRATGVVARPRGSSTEVTIRARAVIVAADALRTPQLLWASGVRPSALGRYLNDQPQVVAAAFLDDFAPEPDVNGRDAHDEGAHFDGHDLHPFHGSPEGGQERMTGVGWIPFDDVRGRPLHGQIMQMDASPIAIGDADVDDDRPIVGIGFFAAKDVRARDRVRFDDARPDEFGLPALEIDYGLTDLDHERIALALGIAADTAAAIGDYIPGGEPALLPAGSSIHYQGSVRMGPVDDGTSVCDSHSAVWGYDNLFVGGNGVIPTATGCNPTLTSVALAIRATERVVEVLR